MNVFEAYLLFGVILGIMNALSYMVHCEPKGRGFITKFIDHVLLIGVTTVFWPVTIWGHFSDFWKLQAINIKLEKLLREEMSKIEVEGKDKDEP